MGKETKNQLILTKEDIKEVIIQYKKMRELLETCPKRKIMMNYEKEWHHKKEIFFKNHPKIEKLYKINLE
jgi:maltodextrin utilization protein YvdJ